MRNINKFLEFSESLKLVRRTRIEDFLDQKNIDDIYTDLLPKNGVINKVNLPRTTILIGRKGTGKSTIFQKSQKDLVTNKNCITVYIDVKSLYDNSTPDLDQKAETLSLDLHKYLLYSNLIKTIVLETRNQLSEFLNNSKLSKFFGIDQLQIDNINEVLDNIESDIEGVIKTVDMSLIQCLKRIDSKNIDSNEGLEVSIGSDPSFKLTGSSSEVNSAKVEFEQTLIKYLDIKSGLISSLIQLKDILKINHLYIFLDDYSEIDESAQKIFMDWFIAPLDNLSEDFVKFKIAAYPNRFYYGKLDNSKIDELSLDFFDAFYSFEKDVDITKMETLALDYTERLLKRRLQLFFPGSQWKEYFELDEKELYDLLFSVSFNIPRKIGYILSYCYESCLIHGQKITKEAIENASQKYYSDVIHKYFVANQFVTKPFQDKISNEHQFELLNRIINRQKTNSLTINKPNINGKPTNHFTINSKIAALLQNLELNGFITTYNNVFDSNSELSVIYSLDYGLCKRHGLKFSRAYNDELLEYFGNARFNMNVLIYDYFNQTQILKCSQGHQYPYEMIENLRLFKMKCPKCLEDGRITICEIAISNVEIKEQLRSIEISSTKQITYSEFLVLDYLQTANKTVSELKISRTLDKSLISTTTVMNKLNTRGLIELDVEISKQLKRDHYLMTPKGERFISSILKIIKKMEIEKAANNR